MKKQILLLSLLIAFFISACDSGKSDQSTEYGKVTQKLVEMVESNPDLKTLLVSSLNQAKEGNPDKNSNPVQSLEEYYEFITWAENNMPWTLIRYKEYPTLYDNMIQSLCYFNYLNSQPLPELEGKGYFNNSLQYVEPYSSWVTSFNRSWGEKLDQDDSWNEDYYQMALADKKFGLTKDWYENPANWKTFNQFFARELKSPDQRPIAAPDDNSVVVSPADSEPQGVWEIDSSSNIVAEQGVAVKAGTWHSIEKLIGEDSEYEQEFANGSFTHSFLNVFDYHRYHFPVSGIIKEVRIIPAHNAVGAIVFWDQENNRYAFDPSRIGWQSLETRGCVIVETEEYGLVAILPIGMAAVCSVNFEETVQVGAQVAKGDKLGYFLFGGSDFIMVFQEKAGFVLEAPLSDDGQYYQHLLVGELYGRLGGETL